MITTCILCLLLWLVECSSGAAESQRYANRWAVEVRGGPEAADALAHKYGLENHGQVRLDSLHLQALAYWPRQHAYMFNT